MLLHNKQNRTMDRYAGFNSNSQYFSKIAGTADCRAVKKRIFLNFLSLTQYFIHEFLLYSSARSFIRFLFLSFVLQYLFHMSLCFLSLSNFHHQVGPISIQLVHFVVQ